MTSRLVFVIGAEPVRLLEHAAGEFLQPLSRTPDIPFPSPSYLLALRQGGLRDDLYALAAARGVPGWLDPPLCVFHELPERLGQSERAPLGDYERLVLLDHVLRRQNGSVFGRLARVADFLDAVDRWFGELVAEGIRPEDYRAAVSGLGRREPFEERRDRELVDGYRRYWAALDQPDERGHTRRDGRDGLVDCARRIAADPDALARSLGGRREIRIFGLHDLRGGWRILLRTLAASPVVSRVLVYAGDELLDEQEELGAQVTRLPDDRPLAARLFTEAPRGRERVDLIVAPDPEREAEAVACRIRALVDGGVPPNRIAVVSRKARPHVDLAAAALTRLGLPVTARQRLPFAEIPVVRAVAALFTAAAEGWSRRTLVELAEHPYIRVGLDPRILNTIGYRQRVSGLDGWDQALTALESEARTRETEAAEPDRHRRPVPPAEWIAEARGRFTRFAAQVRELDRERTLREWVAWLARFLEDDPWNIARRRIYDVPAGRYLLARRDATGWRGLCRIVSEWHAALARWDDGGETLSPAQFNERLRELLAGDAALWTTTARGVVVLEGLAAAYREFDHLFLVGMETGGFPARSPQSPILDDAERVLLRGTGLALDPPDAWETRERGLFRLLVAGARQSLTLSYSRMDDRGAEVLGSAFVEEVQDAATVMPVYIEASQVLTPGMPLFQEPGAREVAAHGARVEQERATGRPGPWNGEMADPVLRAWLEERYGEEYRWSPTQLESFAKCPWAWFSQRLLRLELLEDPDDEMDPATGGTVLHDALARFFAAAGARVGGLVFLLEADLEWALPLMERSLADALAAAESEHWLGTVPLRGPKRDELGRILARHLRAEAAEHEDMFNSRKRKAPRILRTAVSGHELHFEDLELERDGERFRYRGSIDRVEEGIDERVKQPGDYVAAVDYKTSRYSAPAAGEKEGWDDDVVLQVPLYAHALARLEDGRKVSRVEYRALKQGEAVHTLQLYEVDARSGALVRCRDGNERLERALDAAVRHVLRVRGGLFPAAPAPSCGCPPFCHARDICRVKGGPVEKLR